MSKKLYTPLPQIMLMYIFLLMIMTARTEITVLEWIMSIIKFENPILSLILIGTLLLSAKNLFIYIDDKQITLGKLYSKNVVMDLDRISRITWIQKAYRFRNNSTAYVIRFKGEGIIEEYHLVFFLGYRVKAGLKKICKEHNIKFLEP